MVLANNCSVYAVKNDILRELINKGISLDRVDSISERLYSLYDNCENVTIDDIPTELIDSFKEYIDGEAYYKEGNISNYFYVDYKDWYINLPL